MASESLYVKYPNFKEIQQATKLIIQDSPPLLC